MLILVSFADFLNEIFIKILINFLAPIFQNSYRLFLQPSRDESLCHKMTHFLIRQEFSGFLFIIA